MLQEKHCHEFSMKLLDISTVGIIYSTCMLYIANHGNVSLQKLLPRVACQVVVCLQKFLFIVIEVAIAARSRGWFKGNWLDGRLDIDPAEQTLGTGVPDIGLGPGWWQTAAGSPFLCSARVLPHCLCALVSLVTADDWTWQKMTPFPRFLWPPCCATWHGGCSTIAGSISCPLLGCWGEDLVLRQYHIQLFSVYTYIILSYIIVWRFSIKPIHRLQMKTDKNGFWQEKSHEPRVKKPHAQWHTKLHLRKRKC